MSKKKDKRNFIPIIIHIGVDISMGSESGGPVFEFSPLSVTSWFMTLGHFHNLSKPQFLHL